MIFRVESFSYANKLEKAHRPKWNIQFCANVEILGGHAHVQDCLSYHRRAIQMPRRPDQLKERLSAVNLRITKRIKEIEADPRYKAKCATVEINAPLALIQVSMEAEHAALSWARQLIIRAEVN